MPYQAPGLGDARLNWILTEVNKAQKTLDAAISQAQALPNTEPSKAARIIRLNRLQAEVDKTYANLIKQTNIWAKRDLTSMYKQGFYTGAAQLGAGFDFTLPHQEAIELISNDAYEDVATRLQQVSDGFGSKIGLQKMFDGLDAATVSRIQAQSRSSVAQALLTGEDPRSISRRFAQDLWADGVPIIDAGGRQWNPETYTRMLMRTKSANAYNSGSMNKFAEEGVTRVQVFDGEEDDLECAEANGEVWSLRYAMNNVIQHPNCVRAFGPLNGEGDVNRDTEQNWLVTFGRLQLGLGGIAALRSFRATGEVNVSSTLARLALELTESLYGINLPVVDVFIQGLVSGSFKSLDEWIEAYVDPLLYTVGLIDNIPPKAALQAALKPENLLTTIQQSVKQANLDQFGVEYHPGVRQVADRIDDAIVVVQDVVQDLVTKGDEALGSEIVSNVVSGLVGADRFGQITAEVIQQVKAGNVESLRDAWKNAAEFVDELKVIRSSYVDLGHASADEARQIYDDLTELLQQSVALLHKNDDINNYPALLDFMTRYGNIENLDLPRVLAYLETKGRGFDLNAYEMRKLVEMIDAIVTAQSRAIRRLEEVGEGLQSRGQRQLLMAAPAGPDYPSNVDDLWDEIKFDRTVETLKANLLGPSDAVAVDDNVVGSFRELFGMFFIEGAEDLRAEFISTFFNPQFTRNIETFVIHSDIPTKEEQFNFFYRMIKDLEVASNGELLLDGDLVGPQTGGFINEVLGWVDMQGWVADGSFGDLLDRHWNPYFFATHKLGGGGIDEAVRVLYQDMRRAIRNHDPAVLAKGADLDEALTRIYGRSNVSALTGSGANGTIYKVVDVNTGQVILIKSTTSSHGGDLSQVIPSLIGNEYLAKELGGVESIPTRFILRDTDDPDSFLTVMPFVHNSDEIKMMGHAVETEDMRRFVLTDWLTMERDNHGRNYLVNPTTRQSVIIDRENSFGLFWGPSQGINAPSDWGMKGFPSGILNKRLHQAWVKGDDVLTEIEPPVNLVKLTSEEFEHLTGHPISELSQVLQRRDETHLLLKSEGLVIKYNRVDGTYQAFLPTGRMGYHNTGSWSDAKWYPSISTTETEFNFLEELMTETDIFETRMFEEIRNQIDEVFEGLGLRSKERLVHTWRTSYQGFSATSYEDALDAVAEQMVGNLKLRVQNLLNGGVLDITGGTSKTVTREGAEVANGQVVKLTHRRTGEIIEGTVVKIFEKDFETGNEFVLVLDGVGLNLPSADKFRTLSAPSAHRLDDFFLGEPVLDTLEGRIAILVKANKESDLKLALDPTADPLLRIRPKIDDNGLMIGLQETKVHLDVHYDQAGTIKIVTPSGEQKTLRSFQVFLSDYFNELIDAEMKKIPPQFRPNVINPSFKQLKTPDGKNAFGIFDPDTGELHISVLQIFDNGNLKPGDVWGPSSWKYEVTDEVYEAIAKGDMDQLLQSLSWDRFTDVLRHELGHAYEVGLERVHENLLTNRIFQDWANQFPDGPTMERLNELALRELPAGFDVSPYTSNVAALMAHRTQLILDVTNTNQVVLAEALLEAMLRNGDLEPWARAIHAGILRREPEAHHELYAEIYRMVLEDPNGLIGASQKLNVYSEYLDYFLYHSDSVVRGDLPRNWDINSEEFIEWLAENLRPTADRIIPLNKSVNQRLWKAERYSIPDIRKRVLDTPFEEGGGGITINLVTGEEPSTGFSVANKANELVLDIDLSDPKVADEFDQIVADYIKEHKAQLNEPEWELGMWIEKDTGLLYIDTVKIFDDEVDAAVYGFRQGQKAMFNLNTFDEIPLLDGYKDIYEFVRVRKLIDDPEEFMVRTSRIPAVTKKIASGTEMVLDEKFEIGGSTRVMTTDWMTADEKNALIKALAERYTIPMTTAQGKKNLEFLLEEGLKIYADNPALREEFGGFYKFWRASFIDASASTVGKKVQIRVDQIAAAASGMSASLDADLNLATVLNFVQILSDDVVLSKKYVDQIKELILSSAEAAYKRADKKLITAAKKAKEIAYAKNLEKLAKTFKVGQQLNTMDSQRRARALAGIVAATPGMKRVSVPRQWAFYEKSIAVLLGEIEPWEALTDTKFRPFFNNIMDPEDILGKREVTIDFVMANAFFMARGMDKLNHVSPVVRGIQAGLRPIISDTLRELMDEGWGERLGITTDLELQAHIWNIFRLITAKKRNGWLLNLPIVKIKK